MLEQHAIVLKTEGGLAWVEARESGACRSCGADGCSTRRLADLFGRRERAFPVDNMLRANAGERVIIGIPPGALWKSAFGLYGLPLLMLLGGALTGQHLGGDWAAFAGAAGGLALAALMQRTRGPSRACQPIMLRRADEIGRVVHSS